MAEKTNPILKTENLLKILDHLHTAVYIVDKDGSFAYINEAAEKLEHIRKEDAVGRKLVDVYSLTDFEKGMDSPTLDCLNNGVIHIDENLEWYTNDGTAVNALVSAVPFDESDPDAGVFSTAENIADLRERLYGIAAFHKKSSYRLNNKMLKNGTNYVFNDIVGKSEAILSTITIARRFAEKKAPVMIYGETGTGKEMFAQSIHNASPYVSGPFVPINCAAIPDTLLESMLFGTVKGAFTGAVDSPGLFEKAEKGTIFLDEINSMPIQLQAKILRALQEKEVQRIGDSKIRKINCRIISATNKRPEEAIREGELREDLFYRLSTGVIWLPSLKERIGDLRLLIDYFIDKANADFGTHVEGISDDFYRLLEEYYWPGNVRELQNIIESAINLTTDNDRLLDIQHLPTYLKKHFAKEIQRMPNAALIFSTRGEEKYNQAPMINFDRDINTMVDDYEKSLIELALSGVRGNLTKCGEKLGISRQALTFKCKKHHIDPEKYKK